MELRYTEALVKLLPRGKLWNVNPGSVFYKILKGLSGEFSRIEGRGTALSDEASIITATETLPEYAREHGLRPKKLLTVEQKRSQILIKLRDRGGASLEYLIGQVKALGFEASLGNRSFASHCSLRSGQAVRSKKWDAALFVDVKKRYKRKASQQDLEEIEEHLNVVAPASMYIGVKIA